MCFSFRCTSQPGPLNQLMFFLLMILLHSLILFFYFSKAVKCLYCRVVDVVNVAVCFLLPELSLVLLQWRRHTWLGQDCWHTFIAGSRIMGKGLHFFWPEGKNMNNLGHMLRQTGSFSFNICVLFGNRYSEPSFSHWEYTSHHWSHAWFLFLFLLTDTFNNWDARFCFYSTLFTEFYQCF